MTKPTSRNGKDNWTRPDRRDSPRIPVNIAASVAVQSPHGELRSEDGAARIVDLSSTAAGLRVAFETNVDPDDVSAILSRACTIAIDCAFPGAEDAARLSGRVVWYRAIPSTSGISVRLGISLKETSPRELEPFWEFLARLERDDDST